MARPASLVVSLLAISITLAAPPRAGAARGRLRVDVQSHRPEKDTIALRTTVKSRRLLGRTLLVHELTRTKTEVSSPRGDFAPVPGAEGHFAAPGTRSLLHRVTGGALGRETRLTIHREDATTRTIRAVRGKRLDTRPRINSQVEIRIDRGVTVKAFAGDQQPGRQYHDERQAVSSHESWRRFRAWTPGYIAPGRSTVETHSAYRGDKRQREPTLAEMGLIY